MAGISSKAAGGLENRYKYNGIELDTALGINAYEAPLRDLDPQLGRWWQIDPETEDQEMWSPYTSNFDNPILYKDPLGNKGEGCCDGFLDAVANVGDNLMLAAGGALLGAVNTLTFGLVSSDPFNESAGLTSEKRVVFNAFREGGKILPLFIDGGKRIEVVPELVPVGVPKAALKIEPISPEPPISNTKMSTSNSSSTSSKYQTPPAHPNAIKNVVKNASKPGVTLSDAKVAQLKRVVNQSGGTVRTEVGATGSVKGVKHSHVEGYGTKIGSRHIIHTNQD